MKGNCWGTAQTRPNERRRNIKGRHGKLRSRRTVGEPTRGRQQGVQVELKPVTIPRSSEQMRVLQEGKKFKERIRSTPREHPLNHHLIASSPKSPHHSREDKPEQSALTASLSCPYLQKLCKVMGLPLRSQSLTNKAPKCLCSYT